MSAKIQNNSCLRFGELIEVDGVEFWDTLDLPEIAVQPDDLTYSTTVLDRIDLLAQRFYGDPVLWWVIAVANDFLAMPTALNEGTVLRIPSPRYVSGVLFRSAING